MFQSVFSPLESVHDAAHASALRRGITAARRCLGTLGFWAAVSLPFLHIPLLLNGLESSSDALAFGVLVGANLVALLVGHDCHSR
jgi:hypothetical protein